MGARSPQNFIKPLAAVRRKPRARGEKPSTPRLAQSAKKRVATMPLILDPNEPLTGDLLRSLKQRGTLRLARLEMTWGQRKNVDKWQRAAVDAQRVWRGFLRRWLSDVRKDARDARRKAVRHMAQAHAILARRAPDELPRELAAHLDRRGACGVPG